MAVVSLFGIEDTNTLTKKVKEAVVYAQTFNKAEKSGKGHIAKGVNVVKQLSEKVAAFGELFDFGKIKKIAKSANMLLSIDVYDFLPIEKEVYRLRTARTDSTANRARFSALPPYSSVR